MKFRKKPVEVEAVNWHLQEYADNPLTFDEVPDWLKKAIEDSIIIPLWTGGVDYWYLEIKTLEGVMRVEPGDWIIRGVKGELYPCKPDIFEQTYEQLERIPSKCCEKCDGYFPHRVGSHSDDFGGESDYPCYCNQGKCDNKNCECHKI